MHVSKIDFYSKPGKLCTEEIDMKLWSELCNTV